MLFSCVISLFAVPFGREILRTLGVKFKFWGEPVAIFGNGILGNEVANFLLAHPKMGFIPAAVVDRRKVGRNQENKPVIHDQELASGKLSLPSCFDGICTAFVVVPETSHNIHSRLVDDQSMQFERLSWLRVHRSQAVCGFNRWILEEFSAWKWGIIC